MRIALDSNVIIYAEDMDADKRHSVALTLLRSVANSSILIPLQAAGEAMNWLVRKAKVPKPEAANRIGLWLKAFHTQATSLPVMEASAELISFHDFQVWDAVILAAAAEANADLLLSEDMQNGFRWRGVTIVNPFAETPHPLFQELLKQES